jgi:F-type H+-transporting ATPase subunit gamma
MPKPRAILGRVHSVRNVAKITSTMEKIATAKFKKAFDRAVAARPYTDRLGRIIGQLAAAATDFRHPLLETRGSERRVAVLAIAANRGLCGSYNTNLHRTLTAVTAEFGAKGVQPEIHVAGKKLGATLRFHGVPLAGYHAQFEDKPTFAQVEAVATPFMRRFEDGELDALYVVYTKFLSAARQQPVSERVLPLAGLAGAGAEEVAGPDYLFSPDPETLLAVLLPRRVRLHVFQAFLDAAVSEQTARRIAMKLATDNAAEVIRDLTRLYNRSRQALITTEISEIMGGAAALE